jgi:hypothetical protein
MTVTIKGKLPKGDRDGLQALERTLRDDDADGGNLYTIVMTVCPAALVQHLGGEDESYDREWQLKIHQIEVVNEDGDRSFVESVMRTVYERRTGKQALPFGSEGV